MKRNGASTPRESRSMNGSAAKRRKTRNDPESDEEDRTSKLKLSSSRRSLRRGNDNPEPDAEPEARSSPSDASPDEKPSTIAPLPTWLTTGLTALQQKYPTDSFYGTFNSVGEPRVACTDCPGTLYLVGPTDVTHFEPHLRNKKHRTKVTARTGSPSPATFKDQLRYEKPTRSSPLVGPPVNGSEVEAILPGEGKVAAPILPVKGAPSTTTQTFSPTVRIAALEKANAEKDVKIAELERRLNVLEGKSSGLVMLNGEGSQPATLRKRGLGDIFNFFGSPAAT